MPLMLRQGGLPDIEAVYRLNRESFPEYWSRGSLFSALESGYDLLLCEADDQAIAYLLSLSVCDEIQIMQIAVAEPFQRQGVASRMTAALVESAAPDCTLMLEVRTSNLAARKLYEGLGFDVVGIRKKYYAPDSNGNREDAVLMIKCSSDNLDI